MLLIKNGSVYLADGTSEKLDILCEDSKITRIAADIPEGTATVIDATGLQVFPGYVLAVSSVGAHGFSERVRDDSETTSPLNPQLDIVYSLDIREVLVQRFLRAGITSYGLSPGPLSLLAGQMALVATAGSRMSDLVLRRSIALKANFTGMVKAAQGDKPPRSRMAMYATLDEAFRVAVEYMAKEKKDYDEKNEVLARVLRREIPFFVNAYASREIASMLELAAKYQLRLVINGAFDVASCAEEIIAAGHHVVLGDVTYILDGIKYQTDMGKLCELSRQGLKLSLASSNDTAYPAGYEQILWSAALMHRAGATPAEILNMLTINPAQALGVDDLVGSLAEGKRADILICQGDPIARYDARVHCAIVAGKVAYSFDGEGSDLHVAH
ncbi:MAG: amidohydrolase family protein [Symbiobacteriaceae bacterium]|nr:amidohydrolase family protein [Symbiobacteriaceae bacterium]